MGYKIEDEMATENLEMIFLEIPKFLKIRQNLENDLLSQWLMLIAGKEGELNKMKNLNPKVKEAMERIEELSMSPEEWELYESRQKAIINYNSSMIASRKEGEEIGEKRGEKQEKEKIAKKMLGMKMPIEQIIEITKLTKEEIEKLMNEKNKNN